MPGRLREWTVYGTGDVHVQRWLRDGEGALRAKLLGRMCEWELCGAKSVRLRRGVREEYGRGVCSEVRR